MSDKLPGSSYANPIVYKGWHIYDGHPEYGQEFAFCYTEGDYDEGVRHGCAATVQLAKDDIDYFISED